MKNTIKGLAAIAFIAVLIVACLAVYSGGEKRLADVAPSPDSAKYPMASSAASGAESGFPSSAAEPDTADAPPSPAAPPDFDIAPLPEGDLGDPILGESMLSEAQAAAVLTLVQNMVDGYREGWLPLPVIPNTGGRLNVPLPDGLRLPETVAYGDISLTTDGNEMWGGLKATLPLNDGYELDVWLSQTRDEKRGDSIFIIDGGIVKPFLNTQLLSLVGRPLGALKADYGEDYFFYGVGAMLDALCYYEPYVCFYSNSIISGMDGSYPDPLATPAAVIRRIELQGDYDPALGTVIRQTSLRRLFFTEEDITYDLLAAQLGQSPALAHNPGGGYSSIAAREIPEWQALEGGSYSAAYVLEGRDVSISFVESGGVYLALSVSIE